MSRLISYVPWIAGLIFAAGMGWSRLGKTQKDLNGVSGIVKGNRQRADEQYTRISLAIMLFVPEKDKATVAAILGQGMGK
jgi:hypothetical protein